MTTPKQAAISISTHFDSGAIEVVSLVDSQDIQLTIRADQGYGQPPNAKRQSQLAHALVGWSGERSKKLGAALSLYYPGYQ